MSTETKKIEVEKSHPMEAVFDIDEGTTVVTKVERTTDLVEGEEYDAKDVEIDEQVQEIYDAAMEAYEMQIEEAEMVEGKYKARNGEVAAQFLSTALNAVKEKSHLKQHKDKIGIAKGKLGSPNITSKNVIIADRNDILRNIIGGDTEPKEITSED